MMIKKYLFNVYDLHGYIIENGGWTLDEVAEYLDVEPNYLKQVLRKPVANDKHYIKGYKIAIDRGSQVCPAKWDPKDIDEWDYVRGLFGKYRERRRK